MIISSDSVKLEKMTINNEEICPKTFVRFIYVTISDENVDPIRRFLTKNELLDEQNLVPRISLETSPRSQSKILIQNIRPFRHLDHVNLYILM